MKHIELTPLELINIMNAAQLATIHYKEQFSDETRENIKKILLWTWTIHWDNENEKSIMIDELPF